jgi:asparagine synthase (glutamine-hydrolysing)
MMLAAWCVNLSPTTRLRSGYRVMLKRMLHEAGEQLLPERMLTRPKVGFRVPVNHWLCGQMREPLLDHLQGGSSMTGRHFDKPWNRVLTEHLDGRQNHEKLLWALLNEPRELGPAICSGMRS